LKFERAAPNAKFPRHYDPQDIWAAWAKLDEAAGALRERDTYRYDLVDVARQGLVDLSIPLQHDIAAAYARGDRVALQAAADRFLTLTDDLDALLGTRREFLLGAWLEDAKRWAGTPDERHQYERNARLLVTVWGPSDGNAAMLFDYSNRQWSGLISGYYRVRWQKFLAYLLAQPMDGSRFDDKGVYTSYGRPGDDVSPFYRELARWEGAWCEGTERYSDRPAGDSVEVAHRSLAKWAPVEHAAFARFNIIDPADQPKERPPEEAHE
jgi:alpha-N-acetylglucosaminidase